MNNIINIEEHCKFIHTWWQFLNFEIRYEFQYVIRPKVCNFSQKDALAQVFSCESREIFKNTFFTSGGCFWSLIIWKKVMPTQVFFQVFFSEPNRLNIIIKISAKYWKNFMLGTSKFQFTSWFYKFQALANIFFSNKRVNSFLFTLSAIQNYIIIKKVFQIKSETNVGFWV